VLLGFEDEATLLMLSFSRCFDSEISDQGSDKLAMELTVNGFIRLEASRESGRNMDRLIEVLGKSCTHIGSADVNFGCKKRSIGLSLADL